jgi:2-methylcitrate dehydratase PrpD
MATSPTRRLAAYVTESAIEAIPAEIRAEARRAILNYLGCAIGGSTEPALETAIEALRPFSGPPRATVLGRIESFDELNAALLNGIGSHVHEYDDTLPQNYIHPSVPVASALFALASAHPVSGPDFVHAFILGVEVESRIGDAVYPAHYEAGWHITATTGVFGAAAATGKLLRLTTQQMVFAFGLAATQAAGIREMFGSMAKSFQPGRAAENGLTAARLAAAGFTAGEQALEGPRGFAPVTARDYDLDKITQDLGDRFALSGNAYKPYACGLVVHPTIDGMSRIRARDHPDPMQVQSIELRVAPLVLDLCNKRELRQALESKYSIYHAAAIGLARGKGGLREFTQAAIQDPVLARLRDRVHATADPRITEDQVDIKVTLADGRTLTLFLEESLGNVHRPLGNAALEEKFRGQAESVLPASQVEGLIEACWRIDELADAGEIARRTRPR